LGLYLHPRHNMFINGGHTEADIDEALSITEVSMNALKGRYY